MTSDATYMMDHGRSAARLLHRAGHWDEALSVLPADAHPERARILVDRHFWRLEGAEAAEEAVDVLSDEDPVLAGHLDAQVRYTRLLFGLDPRPDDPQRSRAGFTAAAEDSRLSGWAAFWLGVLAEHVDSDPDAARSAYHQALGLAHEQGDALLESYAVRHLGADQLLQDPEQGLALLRRSYHLRASLGARPQIAAAALTLAGELPPGAEADQLRETAGMTARELGLTWLLRAL